MIDLIDEDKKLIAKGMLHLAHAVDNFKNVSDREAKTILIELVKGLEVSSNRLLDRVTPNRGVLS